MKLDVGVSCGSDLEQVERIALQAISALEITLAEPAPRIGFHTLGESLIDFAALFWVDGSNVRVRNVHHQEVKAIKAASDAHGIEFPSPIHTVYLASDTG